MAIFRRPGYDARHRKQYRYHNEWRPLRDENKFARLVNFARSGHGPPRCTRRSFSSREPLRRLQLKGSEPSPRP